MHDVISEEGKRRQKILKDKLSDVHSVSVTMDIWIDASMRGFIGLTVHYIEKQNLMRAVLGVPRFKGETVTNRNAIIFYLSCKINFDLCPVCYKTSSLQNPLPFQMTLSYLIH